MTAAADICISYAREDRAAAERFAAGFEGQTAAQVSVDREPRNGVDRAEEGL